MIKKITIFTFIFYIHCSLLSWNNCPLDQTNCIFPGQCYLYKDTDNDSICDYSQPPPNEREQKIKNNLTKENTNKIASDNIDKGLLKTEEELFPRKYHFIIITLILLILYFISWGLLKKKIISRLTHVAFWTLLLFLSFFISSILGILLIIRINLNLVIKLPFNILFWHVESGIVLLVVGVFHIIYNWRFFKYILRKKIK